MSQMLKNHIDHLRSKMTRGKVDYSKVTDRFAFEISITVIDNAIKNGDITEKEFKEMLKRKGRK
jgi:hypothetical protein